MSRSQAFGGTMACACREARPHLEVLEDPSGQLSIDDVLRSDVARRFAPVAGESDLNFGYSASTYWLRLRLVADAGAARDWLLELAYLPRRPRPRA